MLRLPGHEPLFDVHPLTGSSIEVFYADCALETFGRVGAGWFWCCRRRGYSAAGAAVGPFATSYAAYRNAMDGPMLPLDRARALTGNVNPDTARTRTFAEIQDKM